MGHIGGVMSLVEIVITLYFRIMKLKPEDPDWPDRDRLVLSKGHAGPIVYTALAYKGYFPKDWLTTINKNGTFTFRGAFVSKVPETLSGSYLAGSEDGTFTLNGSVRADAAEGNLLIGTVFGNVADQHPDALSFMSKDESSE